ncbi:MAG: hypothetical protein NVS1B6_00670 [Steroidobacteraceae bacterium]
MRRVCEQHLRGQYDLEVVDIYQQPNAAKEYQIVAAPIQRGWSSTAFVSVAVKTVFDPDLWPVRADAGEFEIALLNLCVNARDAMPKGGTITIGAQNRSSIHDFKLTGDFVEISIADTGEGMDADTLTRCLAPFYTTKDIGKRHRAWAGAGIRFRPRFRRIGAGGKQGARGHHGSVAIARAQNFPPPQILQKQISAAGIIQDEARQA